MTTITKKQIKLSQDVLNDKKLYWAKGSVQEDIEKAITDEWYELVEEYGHNFDRSFMSIYSIEARLREMGYRIWGDK